MNMNCYLQHSRPCCMGYTIFRIYNQYLYIWYKILPICIKRFVRFSHLKSFLYLYKIFDEYEIGKFVNRDFKQMLRWRQGWLTMNNRILHQKQRTFIIFRHWRILHAVLVQSTTLLMALFRFHDVSV